MTDGTTVNGGTLTLNGGTSSQGTVTLETETTNQVAVVQGQGTVVRPADGAVTLNGDTPAQLADMSCEMADHRADLLMAVMHEIDNVRGDSDEQRVV